MAHEYKLSLTMQDTGENVSVSGRFEDEEWERLEEFVRYADDLLKTKFVRSGMKSSFNIRWTQGSPVTVAADLPPWEEVEAFLHRFRPLGLQSEPTYFYRICGILSKALVHPHFRSIIEEQRRIYSGKRLRSGYEISVDSVVLNSEQVLYDWLNSYEYHRDKKKRQFIDSLAAVLPLDASKAIFLGLLAEKAAAIHDIAVLIKVVLGQQERCEGRLTPKV